MINSPRGSERSLALRVGEFMRREKNFKERKWELNRWMREEGGSSERVEGKEREEKRAERDSRKSIFFCWYLSFGRL